MFVTVNNAMIDRDDYSVDHEQKIIFDTVPVADTKINYVTMSNNGEKILDIDTLTGDDCTIDSNTCNIPLRKFKFIRNCKWNQNPDLTTFESDPNYGDEKTSSNTFNRHQQVMMLPLLCIQALAKLPGDYTSNIDSRWQFHSMH